MYINQNANKKKRQIVFNSGLEIAFPVNVPTVLFSTQTFCLHPTKVQSDVMRRYCSDNNWTGIRKQESFWHLCLIHCLQILIINFHISVHRYYERLEMVLKTCLSRDRARNESTLHVCFRAHHIHLKNNNHISRPESNEHVNI